MSEATCGTPNSVRARWLFPNELSERFKLRHGQPRQHLRWMESLTNFTELFDSYWSDVANGCEYDRNRLLCPIEVGLK